LGLLLLAHEYRGECIPCFTEAERLDPVEPRWPYYLGLVLPLVGELEQAICKLRRAVELRPREAELQLRLAELLLAQGEIAEAKTTFADLVSSSGTTISQGSPGARQALTSRAQLGLARAAHAAGDVNESLKLLNQCRESPYARKAALTLMAEVRQTQGETVAVDRLLRQAEDLPDDQNWPDPFVEECLRLQTGQTALLSRAAKLLNEDRAQQASELLMRAVESHPDSSRAWLLLGRACLRLHNLPGAEQAFGQAVRLDPNVADAQFYMGVVLFEHGNHLGAAARFRTATNLKPDYSLAHFNLGQCLKREGDQKAAIEAFRTAVRYKPHFAQAHRELGELLAQQGDLEQAQKYLQHAVDLEPSDAQAKSLLEKVRSQDQNRD
jgi:tetratricopeptide (TPR) repeat protein